MSLFKRRTLPPSLELLAIEDIIVPEPSILDRARDSVGNTITTLTANRFRLETEIMDRTEQLRQTDKALAAFSAAQKELSDGV